MTGFVESTSSWDGDAFAPSPAQEGIWFIENLRPGGASYHIPWLMRLHGPLDHERIRSSIGGVALRHEALRTRFVSRDGVLVQVVDPASSVKVVVEEVAATVAASLDENVRTRLEREAAEPFDLASGPLFRALLLVIGPREHLLLLTVHHIISDGWSMGIIARELSAFYRGTEASLPEIKLQYADFASWQKGQLDGGKFAPSIDYWRERLKGIERLNLLPNHLSPTAPGSDGGLIPFRLQGELSRNIEVLARQERTTVFVILLAAFQVLLARHSGQSDVPVGTPMSNRGVPDLQNMVGMLVNTVVIRSDVSDDPAFRELLSCVRARMLEAHEHCTLPFERLVEELQPIRIPGQTPLFQVMFAWQEMTSDDLSLPGVVVRREAVSTGASKFDLTLEMGRDGDGFFGQLEYRRDLYAESSMGRLLGHYENVLREIVATPEKRISRIAMVGEEERKELIGEWSQGGEAPASEGDGLAGGFRRAAKQNAERIAVACGSEQMTYAELDEKSNQLANYLRSLGVGPEVCVGLCAGASCELIVAILGILKAGGAYVPLDPALPPARLEYIAEDSGVNLILVGKADTGTEWNGREPVFAGQRVIPLSDELSDELSNKAWRSCSPESPETACDERQLAYVIYTSGSTGTPKGVGVTHGNVTRLFGVTEGWGGFSAEDVWTLFHSYGFDFSVWEIWGALLYGGRLEVVPYWVRRSPEQFHELLEKARVTVLNMTPSAFRQLRGYGGGWEGLSVRLVMFGGEALRYEELRGWAQKEGAGVRLVNLYGITETTVHVTRCEVGEAELSGARGASIGGPLNDLRMYVLDERMEPVPVGVAGELYVGGGGVARGYLGRAGLTAARFVPDPWGGERGGRLYRTGDVVRYRGPGEYSYEGRADRQVKIRGHRLELGEVEAALLAQPGIREAVVEQRVDEQGWERLVAYVVGEGEQEGEKLRNALAEQLPEYMVPASYEWLKQVPLTVHGKIDRGALPEPGGRGLAAASYVEPQTQAQRVLAEVWGEVLGVDRVGIHDSFFSLGGDSIRSLQVQARAARRGVRFSLEQLFRHPTIYGLTAAMESAGGGGGELLSVPRTEPFSLIQEEDRRLLPPDIEDAYPLTQLQAGMLYHIALAPESNVYHNTGGRHIRSLVPFDAEAFLSAVRMLVANHAVFRTSFDFHTYSEPLQLVHQEATLPVEIVDLRDLTAEAQEAALLDLLDSERTRRFDLARPTLLRFFVHRRSDETFQFSITECHAIYDGWSYHSAIVELFNTYAAIALKQHVSRYELPELTFRDFVALEREVISNPSTRAFWQRDLEGCTVSLLPGTALAARLRSQPEIRPRIVEISEQISVALQKLARSYGIPLKSLLLAAHIKTLSLLCGASDVVTGLVTNGRPDIVDGDRLFGLFLNSVPFRLRIAQGSWLDLARATYLHESELLPYRRLPLTQIQEVCGRQGLCDETLFNYMDFHVYDALHPALGFEVIGGNNAEGSNITLTAHFQRQSLISMLEKTRVSLQLDYDVNRIGERQIAEIADLYSAVLGEMAMNFTERHDAFSLPRTFVPVRATGAAETPIPHDETFLGRFRACVERAPNAVAVAGGDRRLTYEELDRESSRLARLLHARGIGADAIVGVCLNPSADLVLSLLSIWKAGAAYLPLEPLNPSDRIGFMLKNVGARFTLTTQALQAANNLPSDAVLCLDSGSQELQRYSSDAFDSDALPDNPAYVIYTSGSTGRPKGCAVTRAGFENLLDWYCHCLSGEALSGETKVRALIVSSFGFDLTQKNLFAPLAMGGSVHFSSAPYFDARMIAEQIEREQITSVNCTPSAFYPLLDAVESDNYHALRSLTHATLGGEPISRARVTAWLRSPNCHARLMNSYGPTECADVCVSHWIDDARKDESHPIPIGRPIDRARIFILDHKLNPISAGSIGELYIAGIPVGRGYANDPKMTAERFVPNPFSASGGERLYRTGDRARVDDTALIELVGRVDRQIKVRGFRIEPGEIESVLEGNDNVRWVHVAMSSPLAASGTGQLTAYLLLKRPEEFSARQLRAFLAGRVPEYMIPAVFIALEKIPLTTNGKLDSAALATLRPGSDAGNSAFSAPHRGMEELVAGNWCAVLEMPRIGRNDNIFEVGGDSLRLLQVHGRLENQLARRIPLIEFFNHPTVAAMAQYLETSTAGTGSRANDEIQAAELDSRRRIRREDQDGRRRAANL